MHEGQPWYVRQRAEALALVYLTRREDLVVRQEQKPDSGLDFIVEIVDHDRPTRRVFGIALTGTLASSVDEAGIVADAATVPHQPAVEQLPFPVCLFLFSVKDSRGFYKWLTEPLVTADGAPKLRLDVDGEFKKLDPKALGIIVTKVNQWYDALVTALAA
jgi:hypothetical protein